MRNKCPDCPHAEHEFSTCFEWPECDCSKRYPTHCDNTLAMVLKPEKAFFARGGRVYEMDSPPPNRKSRRKKKKK